LYKIHNDAHKALKYPEKQEEKKKERDPNMDDDDIMDTGYMEF
jgi:hypothetical protein